MIVNKVKKVKKEKKRISALRNKLRLKSNAYSYTFGEQANTSTGGGDVS